MKKEPKDLGKWVEWFIEESKRLRRDADALERAFIEHLRRGELREDAWRSMSITFDAFLADNDICQPKRYRDALRTLELIGAESDVIGMKAAKMAASIQDPATRVVVVAEMVAKANEHHVPLSAQSAAYICRRHVPPARLRSPNERIEELQREVKTLRAQVAERDAIIAQLRARLGEEAAE